MMKKLMQAATITVALYLTMGIGARQASRPLASASIYKTFAQVPMSPVKQRDLF